MRTTIRKPVVALLTAAIGISALSGCMGRHALTKEVEEFNLETVDNRWGREGFFLLLLPVTYVTGIVDLLIVNSIEFWSGKNPINNKGALVDTRVAALENMGVHNVAAAQMRYFDDEVLMYISYKDGSQEVFHATRSDGIYSFYRGKELVLQLREEQLKDLQAAIKAKQAHYAAMEAAAQKS